MKEIVINELNQGQRADKFVRKYLNEAPLSFIYKLFRIKDVKINGKRIDASYILKCGDVMRIYVTDAQLEEFNKPKAILPIDSSLDIIYEDENILIVNKPSSLLVHGDQSEKRRTLSNMVLNYLCSKGEYNPSSSVGFTPAPCHRLDRNTSGLVIFAKNLESLQYVEELFKDKALIKKEYLALVAGRVTADGKVDAPLLKNEDTKTVKVCPESKGGKKALTLYQVNTVFNDCTLLNVQIITGRTHQIRVHCTNIKHPILGDAKYGDFNINRRFEKKFNYKNQFLHAHKITFLELEGKLSYLSNKTFVAKLNKKESDIISTLKEGKNANLF